MQIRHKTNGGIADVSQELADKLISRGVWEPADKPAPRRGRKPAPKSVEVTETTE